MKDKTNQLISGNNDKEKPILSLLTKRTYSIDYNGNCTLSKEQKDLIETPEFDEEKSFLFINDTDLYAYKRYTDIVVKGYARNVKSVKSFVATIELDKLRLDIQIFANRSVFKNNNGLWQFNTEENINEIPLEYEFAYGGKDLIAEQVYRDKIEAEEKFKHIHNILNIYDGSQYRYPRNPEGKGYILETSNEAIENFELPNLEDPYNLLTPQNFICPGVDDWHKMPLPIATNWVSSGWFPRVAYFGKYPLPKGYDEDAYEIRKKLVDKNILKSSFRADNPYFNYRACNGASLGLQSRSLEGGESCKLTNIHPSKAEFVFKLPSEQPKIKIDGRNGKLLNADVTMHSVVIEPDKHELSIVWCGSVKALRPYMDEELEKMPFEISWK